MDSRARPLRLGSFQGAKFGEVLTLSEERCQVQVKNNPGGREENGLGARLRLYPRTEVGIRQTPAVGTRGEKPRLSES
ncbi:hypothetical protein H8959_011370 [Pygathrix nigripes]